MLYIRARGLCEDHWTVVTYIFYYHVTVSLEPYVIFIQFTCIESIIFCLYGGFLVRIVGELILVVLEMLP